MDVPACCQALLWCPPLPHADGGGVYSILSQALNVPLRYASAPAHPSGYAAWLSVVSLCIALCSVRLICLEIEAITEGCDPAGAAHGIQTRADSLEGCSAIATPVLRLSPSRIARQPPRRSAFYRVADIWSGRRFSLQQTHRKSIIALR